MSRSGIDKTLKIISNLPKLTVHNVKDLPNSIPSKFAGLQRKKRGLGHRGRLQFQHLLPIGHLNRNTPSYLSIPFEPYNKGHLFRRNLPRISLLDIQRCVELGRLDPEEPIDLTSLCNTSLFKLHPEEHRDYGFHLSEEGLDNFASPINLEVQFASEAVIAAVERAGGSITTRFYDLYSIYVKKDPLNFFREGLPIPKAKLPPQNAIEYYSGAVNRGYLANLEDIDKARYELAQKYGYPYLDLATSPRQQLLTLRKSPLQLFWGLQPGSLVSLEDKTVYLPTDPAHTDFYSS